MPAKKAATAPRKRTPAAGAAGEIPTLRLQPAPEPKPVAAHASEADIRRRAYEIYLERNGEPGNPVLDWLRAEQELQGRTAPRH